MGMSMQLAPDKLDRAQESSAVFGQRCAAPRLASGTSEHQGLFGETVDGGDGIPGSPEGQSNGPRSGRDRSERIDGFEQANTLVADLDAVFTSKSDDGL